VKTDMPLVIVGGAPYAAEYITQLKSTRDKRVRFLGFVFGEDYRALQQNAYCYVHATEVGGTHPALIEAMGAGNCALTLRTAENLEVVGDAGIIYQTVDDLAWQMQRVIDEPAIIAHYRQLAMSRVMRYYNWEQITDQYEELLSQLAGVEVPRSVPIPAEPFIAETLNPLTYPATSYIDESSVKARSATKSVR